MTEFPDIDTLSHGVRFNESLPTAVRWSHALLAPRLRPGDVVVDATLGNGHDTFFLAERVLPEGRIFGFDIQEEAVASTTRKLVASFGSIPDGVSLFAVGHERMDQFLPHELFGGVRAFMFNLGWLPGSNKSRITTSATTLAGLKIAADWLAEGGLVTVVCYPGHDGGDSEADDVERWMGSLPATEFEAQKLAFVNLEGAPPRCFVARKRRRAS